MRVKAKGPGSVTFVGVGVGDWMKWLASNANEVTG